MPSSISGHLSRRRLLAGVTATGAAAAASAIDRRASSARQSGTPVPDWSRFDDDVQAAMETFSMVGAAIAVVDGSGIVHSNTYGLRDQASGEPVTPDTHFLVASTTKSMASLLVATFVDDGIFAWDQPVREVWPDFQAPTTELTDSLRVRDLLGMASGLGEADAVSAFHQGDVTAGELLRSVATLPVIAAPNTTYFYNGTVYSAGGYLPPLAQGVAEADLETVFATLMAERVYHPAGMGSARITDDPRPFVDNYATGYAPDMTQDTAPQPYAPVGSFAPAGGTLATLTDMANYVAMQLNRGVSVTGERVVSAENLAECWRGHIALPMATSGEEPAVVGASYGMGWVDYTYRGGRRFVGHSGGIDGFTTFIGFFPGDNLGLVVLTNMGPYSRGLAFAPVFVPNLLMASQFGLNGDGNDAVVADYQAAEQHLADLAAQAAPVDLDAIALYLGHYEKSWRVALDADGELRMHQSSRAIRLLAMPDGSYVMAGGVIPGNVVRFSHDDVGMPWLEIENLETVRWLTGLPSTPSPVATPSP
jgi:CubicO group peptidase (beta-lactamase class C family)